MLYAVNFLVKLKGEFLIDFIKKLLYNYYRKRKEIMLTQSSEKGVVDKNRKTGRRKQNLIRIREEVWFDSHTARDSVLLVLGLVLKYLL